MSGVEESHHDHDDIFINRLSPGILGDVFVIYCQSKQFSLAKHAPQLTISQVCSLWRTIAYQTPQVWTNFAIRLTDIDDADPLREWLTRAKSAPLDITVSQRSRSPAHPNTIACLASFISSCRSLDLRLSWDSWVQLQFQSLAQFPHLMTANAIITGSSSSIIASDSERVAAPLMMFFTAPNLTSVTFRSLTYRLKRHFGPQNHVSLPTSRLTSLSLDLQLYGSDLNNGFATIAACTNLVACKVWLPPVTRQNTPQNPIAIVLPNLEFLTVTYKGDYGALVFLKNASLPFPRRARSTLHTSGQQVDRVRLETSFASPSRNGKVH